jgi:excisionase family DNA binding protein
MLNPKRTKAIDRRAEIWDTSGGICYYCEKPMHPIRDFTVDHRMPVSKGGTDDRDNLVAACWPCNSEKRARILEQSTPSLPPIVITVAEMAAITNENPELASAHLTVQEITKILKVHEESVRRWIRSGELPAKLLGSSKGGYRVRRGDFDAFTERKFRAVIKGEETA